ncbi:MAG: methyltransferase [Candidatus Dadabacteria bacterium]|nr:methyltransferase [Candidatus Dadabacteria bacterium]NIQ16215.1 methyltransferase [Candidatus Dadabacteria bacterium]
MEIRIDNLTYGGKGIGTVNGKKIFVRGALPGDYLKVQIIKDKKSFSEAIINEIISPSKNRIEAECGYFERCGGCHWQNLDYKVQLEQKEEILKDSLERIGGFKNSKIEKIEKSPKQYGYRKRLSLTCWYYKDEHKIGYYQENSKNRISIEECPISASGINEEINYLSSKLSEISVRDILLDRIILAEGDSKVCATFFSAYQQNISKIKALIKHINRSGERNYCVQSSETNSFEFTLLNYKLYSVPSVFIQANSEINEKIVIDIIDVLKSLKINTMLDLYCGIGNFSLPASEFVEELIGVDINSKAIELAKRNQKINKIKNIRFNKVRSDLFLKELKTDNYGFDLILMDPPREGAKDIIAYIIDLNPKYVMYVSCNPTTLARDLKMLESANYSISKIKPYDMFPNTYHIETLVLLEKN